MKYAVIIQSIIILFLAYMWARKQKQYKATVGFYDDASNDLLVVSKSYNLCVSTGTVAPITEKLDVLKIVPASQLLSVDGKTAI